MVASPVQQKLPPLLLLPLLPPCCLAIVAIVTWTMRHKSTASLGRPGGGGGGGGLTFAHDAIFFSPIRPRSLTLMVIGQLECVLHSSLLSTPFNTGVIIALEVIGCHPIPDYHQTENC